MIIIFDQQGDTLKERMQTMRGKAEQRVELTYKLDGVEATQMIVGNPTKIKASVEGSSIVIDQSSPGSQMKETYTVSGDTMTIKRAMTRDGRSNEMTQTLAKSPESAGVFDTPEKKGADCYENLQIMQAAPCTSVIAAMNRFQTALGVRCNHCHTPPQMAKDDKKEKQTARMMMTMTRAINQDHLKGNGQVGCYTCHKGQVKPQGAPAQP